MAPAFVPEQKKALSSFKENLLQGFIQLCEFELKLEGKHDFVVPEVTENMLTQVKQIKKQRNMPYFTYFRK